MYKSRKGRKKSGASAAELAGAMVIIMPIVAIAAWVAVEATEAYMINSALHQAALIAARRVAIAYGTNPTGTKANPGQYFNNLQIGNMVRSPAQFSIPSGTAGWNESANPPTVTVVCTYTSGQNGCPVFPSPDPLKLGNSFQLQARGTFRLE